MTHYALMTPIRCTAIHLSDFFKSTFIQLGSGWRAECLSQEHCTMTRPALQPRPLDPCANHWSAVSSRAIWRIKGVSNKPFGSPRDPLWIPDWMLNISTLPWASPMMVKFPQELIAVVWGSKSLQRTQCFTQFTLLLITNFTKHEDRSKNPNWQQKQSAVIGAFRKCVSKRRNP